MDSQKRDKTKVDPLSGGEEPQPAAPLQSVPEGMKPDATSATIPGTGAPVQDASGKEAKRVIRT